MYHFMLENVQVISLQLSPCFPSGKLHKNIDVDLGNGILNCQAGKPIIFGIIYHRTSTSFE